MRDALKRLARRLVLFVASSWGVRFCRQCYRRIMWRLVPIRAIPAYLHSHHVRKLQIGAGPNVLEGWLNTDEYPLGHGVIYLDAAKPFPFRDFTFDRIFNEHQIEHLSYNQGLHMLRECYRVLKPGGRIRFATPDLATIISLYTIERSDPQQRYIDWIVGEHIPEAGTREDVFVINNAFRHWGHRFIYDRATLQSAMEGVGFTDVVQYRPGESDDDTFRGIESHGKSIGDEDMNQFETMVLEAQRPV